MTIDEEIKILTEKIMDSFPDMLDFNDLMKQRDSLIEQKLIENIENFIIEILNRYQNCSKENLEYMHERIDELFLLWGRLIGRNFAEVCGHFGIVYEDFSEHNHFNTINQIRIKYNIENQEDY